jgi:hypothetical protein
VLYIKRTCHTKPHKNFTQSKYFVFADLWRCEVKVKVKQNTCYRLGGFQEVEVPRLGGKGVSPTHRSSLPPVVTRGPDFYNRQNRTQGHNAAGRIMSMKNFNDIIGNLTRDLPACSANNFSIK